MKKCIPVLLMLTILICGCSKQAQESTSEPVSDTFFAMDTTMDFRIYGDKSLLQDAQNVITDLKRKCLSQILTVRFIKSMKMVPEF